jgi:hypothetical protein
MLVKALVSPAFHASSKVVSVTGATRATGAATGAGGVHPACHRDRRSGERHSAKQEREYLRWVKPDEPDL